MLFGKYHFSCIFTGPASLPAFKGSTFRGVFGVALKKVVCALKHQECPACLLRGQCLYARIFETALSLKYLNTLRAQLLSMSWCGRRSGGWPA